MSAPMRPSAASWTLLAASLVHQPRLPALRMCADADVPVPPRDLDSVCDEARDRFCDSADTRVDAGEFIALMREAVALVRAGRIRDGKSRGVLDGETGAAEHPELRR